MTQSKLTLLIPAYLGEKTDSIAGTVSVKKILASAFAGLPPPVAAGPGSVNEANLLLADLQTLIDRLFVARVSQKADQLKQYQESNQ
jgi:hypothetical protein